MTSRRDLGRSVSETRIYGEQKSITRVVDSKPIGIKTPLEKGTVKNETLFKMHFNIVDQIKDNLKNLIMTQKGERLGYPDFGTNLRAIYSNTSLAENEDLVADYASQDIKKAVEKYMPNLNLVDFYSKEASIEELKLDLRNKRIEELKNKKYNRDLNITLSTAEMDELQNLEGLVASGIGQSQIAGYNIGRDFLEKQGSTQVTGSGKAKSGEGQINPNKNKIYEIVVNYNVPLLNNLNDSITLFINSGI